MRCSNWFTNLNLKDILISEKRASPRRQLRSESSRTKAGSNSNLENHPRRNSLKNLQKTLRRNLKLITRQSPPVTALLPPPARSKQPHHPLSKSKQPQSNRCGRKPKNRRSLRPRSVPLFGSESQPPLAKIGRFRPRARSAKAAWATTIAQPQLPHPLKSPNVPE